MGILARRGTVLWENSVLGWKICSCCAFMAEWADVALHRMLSSTQFFFYMLYCQIIVDISYQAPRNSVSYSLSEGREDDNRL